MPTTHTEDQPNCPCCGAPLAIAPDAWIKTMAGGAPPLCERCQRAPDGSAAAPAAAPEEKPGWRINYRFFVIAFVLSALVVYLNRRFQVLSLEADKGQIVYEFLLILIVSSALSSGKLRQNLKYLAVWIGIFILFMVAYSYRFELAAVKARVVSEFIPSRGAQHHADVISFPAASDGHYYILAEVNGVPILFLADTGATDIVLSPRDAEKLGVDLDELSFDRVYETANGTVRGSSIRLDNLSVGGIHLQALRASVNEAQMRQSLLGMRFFKRLRGYEVKNGILTLYGGE